MRPRLMEVFDAVMRCGSVTLAAERLHIAQPSVSKMLRTAEEEAGVPLFERHHARLYPTPEARLLHQEMTGIFEALDHFNEQALAQRRDGMQRIAIGLAPSLTEALAPELATLPALGERSTRMLTLDNAAMTDALRAGTLDFGLSYQPSQDAALRCEPLCQGWLMLVSRARAHHAYALACRREEALWQTDAEDLAQAIGVADTHPVGHAASLALAQHRPGVTQHTQVSTPHQALTLAHHTGRSTIIDSFSARHAAPPLSVYALRPAVSITLWLIHTDRLAPRVRQVIRVLAGRLSRLPAMLASPGTGPAD